MQIKINNRKHGYKKITCTTVLAIVISCYLYHQNIIIIRFINLQQIFSNKILKESIHICDLINGIILILSHMFESNKKYR